MDTKKIGQFLKALRKEKSLTQEQLAEIFFVSGKTVSRWENGANMPDLSLLIQLAEFYSVDVKEILDGERKGDNVDKELKDTLTKVADYSNLEKEKTVKIGNISFGISFAVCVMAIIIQLLLTGNIRYVAGETLILLIGGITYLVMMSYNGIYEMKFKFKNSIFADAVISIIFAVVFTIILTIYYSKIEAEASQIIYIALIFFAVISIAGFIILRLLAYFSATRKNKIVGNKSAINEELQVVNVYVADGNLQANMIIETLRNNGIMAYGQDLGDAGFAAARYGMGRGNYDGVAIFVASDNAEKAKQVIREMGMQ